MDTERRPDRLSEAPEQPLDISFKEFVVVFTALARGCSGGPGGMTYEHLKVALGDEDTMQLMHNTVLSLARAEVPEDIADSVVSSWMTALLKDNGRVRGIATGTSSRRPADACMAEVIGEEVDKACAPFQYALSTRAGTECVGHLFRYATDKNPEQCVLSIDGVGAYDHIKRAAMLGKLRQLPAKASAALPFVMLSYGKPSKYSWYDEAGVHYDIPQGEGGEQGDPLMPLLFSLGIHEALESVSRQLQPGEEVCAFLDDVYALCKAERVAGPRWHRAQSRQNKGVEQSRRRTTSNTRNWCRFVEP